MRQPPGVAVREITPSWQLWIALAYLVFMVSSWPSVLPP